MGQTLMQRLVRQQKKEKKIIKKETIEAGTTALESAGLTGSNFVSHMLLKLNPIDIQSIMTCMKLHLSKGLDDI